MNIYVILIEIFEFTIYSISSMILRLSIKNIVIMYGLPTYYSSQIIWHIYLIILYGYILISMGRYLSYFRSTDLRNKYMAKRTQNMKIVGFVIAFSVNFLLFFAVHTYSEYLKKNMQSYIDNIYDPTKHANIPVISLPLMRMSIH